MKPQSISVSDLGLASALRTLGFNLIEIKPLDSQRWIFVFEDNGRYADAEEMFWGNHLPVDALAYFTAIRDLKSILYAQKKYATPT